MGSRGETTGSRGETTGASYAPEPSHYPTEASRGRDQASHRDSLDYAGEIYSARISKSFADAGATQFNTM